MIRRIISRKNPLMAALKAVGGGSCDCKHFKRSIEKAMHWSHKGAGLGALGSSKRGASIQPEALVYSGPQDPPPKRVTLRTLGAKYRRDEPITMVTAYDYPSAVHVDQAGIDILLVGDSVGMVVHGHDTTLPVTLDEILGHCKSVSRGSKRCFLLGDLPFGTYEASPEQAVHSSVRLMKEGQMDAVKMEGASPKRIQSIKAAVDAGVAVMGHVGLTPQMISVIGGFRPQGQAADGALKVVKDAMAVCDAGCFGLVLECVPAAVGAAVQKAVNVPVIGIGAGPDTDGQVLVYHDLLGFMQHPHHAKVTPRFCKQYGQVGTMIQDALCKYKNEVQEGVFPSREFSPYKMKPEELDRFTQDLSKAGHWDAANAASKRADLDEEKK